MKWELGSHQIEPRDIEGRQYIPMNLAMEDSYGLVRLPQGRAIGVLNSQAFEALLPCIREGSFHIEMLIPQNEWDIKMEQLNRRGAATLRRQGIVMNAELILFGPEILGDTLAKSLGRYQLFLQPPPESLSGNFHSNPQSLSLPNMHARMEIDTADSGLREALASRGFHDLGDTAEPAYQANSASLANLVADIDNFFDHIPSFNHRSIASTTPLQWMVSSLFPCVSSFWS